ncbi:MAG: capsular biosynthesis protein [Magnetococcales bacterium]|nr:capsular biosynthesis protein [Magnetococcales bacterium]
MLIDRNGQTWIDIHCHLLPGLDDGAATLDETLHMARMAVADGIGHIVATPHFTPGIYVHSGETVQKAASSLRDILRRENIALELSVAADIRLGPEMMDLVRRGELPILGSHGEKSYFLLEFPHDSVPAGSLQAVQWLLKQGLVPVLTHPERNLAIQQRLDILAPFLDAGCLVQVTADALIGRFGALARQIGEKLLQRGWVHVLATDAHDPEERPPLLSPGLAAAARWVGWPQATAMVTTTPARMLGGRG